MIQSILIPRKTFTQSEAYNWIVSHKFKPSLHGKKVHITNNYYRYRQKPPKYRTKYKIITLSNGVKFILEEY